MKYQQQILYTQIYNKLPQYMNKSTQKAKESCQICKKKFGGVFSNQHQCKRCQRTICKQCCTKKKLMFTKNSLKMQQHRCCDSCLPQSQNLMNYVKQNNTLSFGSLSKQGKQWAQLADIQIVEGSRSHSGKNKSKLQFSNFLNVWAEMTASLRQFTGLIIGKMSITNVQTVIRNVSEKIYVTGNIQDSNINLIIYFLCYCDDVNTKKIINYLFSIAEHINQKNIEQNIEILCNQVVPKIDEKLTKSLINYTKSIYKSFTYTYFINIVQMDIVHHVILQTLLSGDSHILELMVCCIIFQFRNHILFWKYDQKQLKNCIWQNLSLKNIQRSMKKLRKSILKSNSPKKQKQQTEKKQVQSSFNDKQRQKSSIKLSQISFIQKKVQSSIVEQNEQQRKKQQIILAKILQAEQFMKRMQSGELNEKQISLADAQQLQKYLDLIIQQNDKSLKQCQQFDKLLSSIQDQLYMKNTSENQSQVILKQQ